MAPDELLGNGHLHHILPKIAGEKYYTRILELQKKLWHIHKIDPFMGSQIFVWSGMQGVHSDAGITYVMESLEKLFKKNPETTDVLKELNRLGEWAQNGGVQNSQWIKDNLEWLKLRGFRK